MGIKNALQRTFLYTIYLFLVKYIRKFKKKVKKFFNKIRNIPKRIKRFLRGKYNRLYTEYVIAHLYPSIYKGCVYRNQIAEAYKQLSADV